MFATGPHVVVVVGVGLHELLRRSRDNVINICSCRVAVSCVLIVLDIVRRAERKKERKKENQPPPPSLFSYSLAFLTLIILTHR